MKPLLFIALCTALLFSTATVPAQRARSGRAKAVPAGGPDKGQATPRVAAIFLGRSSISGGAISKRTFDSLAAQGVRAADEAGTALPVRAFDFSFAERGFYEDSVGNPIVVVDQISERCLGDTLPPYIAYTLPERTKPGDTIRFDRVRVTLPDGREGSGKAMLFVLTR